MTKTHYAKGFKCVEEDCEEQAEALWPIVDPDIQAHPYCKECLDEIDSTSY